MTAAFAVVLFLAAGVGPALWLATALPASLAYANGLVWAVLVAGAAGALAPEGNGAWLAAGVVAAGLVAAGAYLRLRYPLARLAREARRESLANRGVAWLLLAILGFITGLYLWANAVHPPVLADTVFRWSGPARGLGPAQGFPVRLSQLYYGMAATDLGWKFLWSALSLLPAFVLFGVLRYQGRGRLAAAGAALAPALSFSLLFWGSSGQPHLFLTGVVMLAWAWLLEHRRLGLFLAWPALALLVWSGPYWGALGGVALLAYAARRDHAQAPRLAAGLAGACLLLWWTVATDPAWALTGKIVAYYARDAWNTARYGPLTYLAFAFFLRGLDRTRSTSTAAAGIVASLLLFTLELAGRDAKSVDVLLHVTGNQLFASTLLLGWFLVITTSRPRH